MQKIAKLAFALSSAVFLALFLLTLYLGYNQTLDLGVSVLHHKQHSDTITGFISVTKYHYLQAFFVFLSISCALSAYFLEPIYAVIAKYTYELFTSLRNVVISVLRSEGAYLLIVPGLSSIYLAFHYPIMLDESGTYMDFTSRGVLSSMILYPSPQNHILHSVITNFTKYFFFLPPLIRMRSSAMLASALTWILAYSMLSKYLKKNVALFIVGISSMLFISVFYSFPSRGYSLLELFFVAAFYASLNIILLNNRIKDWVAFGVACVLGFYTIPAFLYPFVILNALILIFNYKNLLIQIKTNIAILAVVGLLYAPVVIVNGLGALTQNRFVAPISRHAVWERLPAFLLNSITQLTGICWQLIIPLLLLSFLLLAMRKRKEYCYAMLLFMLSPGILLLAHSVIPGTDLPSRIFIYYAFLIVLFIALPYEDILQRVRSKYLTPCLMVIQVLLFFNAHSELERFMDLNIAADKTCHHIAGNNSYLIHTPMIRGCLYFTLRTGGFDNASVFESNDSLYLSADTIHTFDYVIISKKVDQTVKRKPGYESKYDNVYYRQ